MIKEAQNQFPLNSTSKNRWSPRAFSQQAVETEKLQSLFEAARWSPSAGNEQPWRYLVGLHPDETWEKIFSTLDSGNQEWVMHAPVLALAIGKTTRGSRNAPNAFYAYDTGQSVAHLTFQAAHMGLFLHQMGGFNGEMAAELFAIPSDFKVISAFCLGYLGDPTLLSDDQRESETTPRTRKGFHEFVFSKKFGEPSSLF